MKQLLRNYQLYIFLFPMVAYFVIFRYFPMYGVQIAFKDFYPLKGIWDSSWVGFEHFQRFFRSSEILMVIKNTLLLNLFSLIFGFPVPIILALMINQVLRMKFKKLVQTVIYAPHFISTVVIVGMVSLFLSPRSGVVNSIIKSLGLDPVFFMARPEFFKAIYIISEIWQHAGWGTIIYLAALASISPELHESAVVDGASKWQRVWYIDIPGIMATAVILLILESGRMLSLGFEKVYLMQNNLNRSASEVISTYVYKVGIQQADFSYATAIGLFEAVICLIVLMSVNMLAKKATNTSLW
ncbi:ABC transporter permease [Paenibacillus castaneae]|uniref:ABC transporter permease n=1 Tax=Paenibacillus castaneae TaxID=474957 RepID=UPI001FBB4F8A|nr:ABC transporter permease subunit [Paenibacillus castaneae]